MINSKYSKKNILKIIFSTEFYSISIYIIYIAITKKIALKECMHNFFPIIFNQYWFITYYCILFFIIPYINMLLKNLKKQELEVGIIMFGVILYIIPTITNNFYGLSKLIYLIYGYMLGGYVSLYKKKNIFNKYISKKIFLYVSILEITYIIILNIIATRNTKLQYFTTYLGGISKVTTIILALEIFCMCINKSLKTNKYINYIAKHTLAVYIITDNVFIRELLWRHIFYERNFNNIFFFIIYILISISLTFTMAIIIDIVKEKIVDKTLLKKYVDFIEKIFNNLRKNILKIKENSVE